MKDSQQKPAFELEYLKYIKANNERFSTGCPTKLTER